MSRKIYHDAEEIDNDCWGSLRIRAGLWAVNVSEREYSFANDPSAGNTTHNRRRDKAFLYSIGGGNALSVLRPVSL